MVGKSCFFIGHREVSHDISEALRSAVETHIAECGVTEFVVGHYGAFDRMAASAVVAAKKKYPNITLLLLLPYHPSQQAVTLPKGFDTTYYPLGMENVPRRLAILRANQYMVDRADFLIAYVWHAASNARDLLEFAQRRASRGKLNVLNIAPLP